MMRRLAVLATAVLLGATLVAPAAHATGDGWRTRAVAALAAWHVLDDQDPMAASAFALSYAGLAEASLNGWDSPAVASLLARVMALRNPDGGWGLNATSDTFSDGTVNPATTTYTVTVSDHVGPFLLGAWQHGLVGIEPLTTIGNLLVHMPRWTVDSGTCLAYSTSPNDQQNSGMCIHNASAAAALFLGQLATAGVSISGATSIRGLIVKAEVGAYVVSAKNWPYAENGHGYFGGPYNDVDHEALNVEMMLDPLAGAPSLGYLPQVNIMLNSFPTDPNSPLAHFRLGATRCSSADQWFGEFDAWLAAPPSPAIIRLAQMARWAARNADVCEGT